MTTVANDPGRRLVETDLSWLERLSRDPSLQAFVSAEITRAGIELDTIKWQRDHDRVRIATLLEQLGKAHALITKLRRKLGRGRRLESEGIS